MTQPDLNAFNRTQARMPGLQQIIVWQSVTVGGGGSRAGGRPSLAGAGGQVVVVEQRVKQQEVTALRFVAPHRVIGEQQHVALAARDIDHGGSIGQFAAAGEHSGNEQILFFGKPHDDARALGGGGQESAESFALIVIERRLFAGARLRTRRWRDERTALRDIRIGVCPASGGPAGSGIAELAATASAESQAARCADLQYRRLAEVDGEIVAVAVGDGALLIGDYAIEDAAPRLQLARSADTD